MSSCCGGAEWKDEGLRAACQRSRIEETSEQEIVSVLRNSTLTRHKMALWQGLGGRQILIVICACQRDVFSRASWAPLILLYLFRLCSDYDIYSYPNMYS